MEDTGVVRSARIPRTSRSHSRTLGVALTLALILSLLALPQPAVADEGDPAAWRGGIAWEHVFLWDSTDDITGNRSYGTQTRMVRWDFVGDGDARHPEGTQTAEASYDRLSTQTRRTWTGTQYVYCTTVTSQTFTQIGPSESANMRVGYTPSSESWWGSGSHRIYGTWKTVTERDGPDGCVQSSFEDSREDYFQAAQATATSMVPLPAPQDAQKLSGVVATSDATNNNVWRTTWNLARGDAEPDPWPGDDGESNGDNGDNGDSGELPHFYDLDFWHGGEKARFNGRTNETRHGCVVALQPFHRWEDGEGTTFLVAPYTVSCEDSRTVTIKYGLNRRDRGWSAIEQKAADDVSGSWTDHIYIPCPVGELRPGPAPGAGVGWESWMEVDYGGLFRRRVELSLKSSWIAC